MADTILHMLRLFDRHKQVLDGYKNKIEMIINLLTSVSICHSDQFRASESDSQYVKQIISKIKKNHKTVGDYGHTVDRLTIAPMLAHLGKVLSAKKEELATQLRALYKLEDFSKNISNLQWRAVNADKCIGYETFREESCEERGYQCRASCNHDRAVRDVRIADYHARKLAIEELAGLEQKFAKQFPGYTIKDNNAIQKDLAKQISELTQEQYMWGGIDQRMKKLLGNNFDNLTALHRNYFDNVYLLSDLVTLYTSSDDDHSKNFILDLFLSANPTFSELVLFYEMAIRQDLESTKQMGLHLFSIEGPGREFYSLAFLANVSRDHETFKFFLAATLGFSRADDFENKYLEPILNLFLRFSELDPTKTGLASLEDAICLQQQLISAFSNANNEESQNDLPTSRLVKFWSCIDLDYAKQLEVELFENQLNPFRENHVPSAPTGGRFTTFFVTTNASGNMVGGSRKNDEEDGREKEYDRGMNNS